VSEFYRNPEQWHLLEEEIFPYLFEKFGNSIKIWSAACSTGDEPYTLAMVLGKFVPLNQIQIIATDIDKQVLGKAQLGIYDEKSLKGLPKELKDKYFHNVDSKHYQISDEIKKCVKFSQHNLLKDAYPDKCDLIVCRNVMIYFTEEAKQVMYQKFNDSLKPEGILFVGSTEQIISPASYNFTTFQSFFYKKG
jgi:chemotaxis protein methyltransferase CheR